MQFISRARARTKEGFSQTKSDNRARDSYLGYHRRCRGFLAFYAYAKDVHITKDPPRTFSFALVRPLCATPRRVLHLFCGRFLAV